MKGSAFKLGKRSYKISVKNEVSFGAKNRKGR